MDRDAERKGSRVDVAAVLKRLREERDWTQPTLARRARIGLATIARIESRQVNARTGKVDVPKPTTLQKLAEALGDGNARRIQEARHQLFLAAGYGEEDIPEPGDAAQEIARLRERVEALERQAAADPRGVEQRIQRLLESYDPDKRAMALRLMQQALERYDSNPLPPPEEDADQ